MEKIDLAFAVIESCSGEEKGRLLLHLVNLIEQMGSADICKAQPYVHPAAKTLNEVSEKLMWIEEKFQLFEAGLRGDEKFKAWVEEDNRRFLEHLKNNLDPTVPPPHPDN